MEKDRLFVKCFVNVTRKSPNFLQWGHDVIVRAKMTKQSIKDLEAQKFLHIIYVARRAFTILSRTTLFTCLKNN